MLSPPCQPYTILNHQAKGDADPRASNFLHLIENVLLDMCSLNGAPDCILVENVAGFEVQSFVHLVKVFECLLGSFTQVIDHSPNRFEDLDNTELLDQGVPPHSVAIWGPQLTPQILPISQAITKQVVQTGNVHSEAHSNTTGHAHGHHQKTHGLSGS